jgi:glutathione S-transferase
MRRIVSVYENYAFPVWVQVLVTQRLFQPLTGAAPDETAIADALPRARHVAAVLDGLLADRVGRGVDFADLYLAPAVRYLEETPEGAEILDGCAHLAGWWRALRERPSVAQIAPPTATCDVGRPIPST